MEIPVLNCSFEEVQNIWQDSYANAYKTKNLNLQKYQQYAEQIAAFGRGADPVLSFISEIPQIVRIIGENISDLVFNLILFLQKSPNSKSIALFLQHLPAISRCLESPLLLKNYLKILRILSDKTSVSVHGIHSTHPSVALPVFIENSAKLLKIVNVDGLKKWAEYGILYFKDNPEHQTDFFSLKTSDSKSMLQRQRAGTLLINIENSLQKYAKSLWDIKLNFRPQPVTLTKANPAGCFLDDGTLFMPDSYDTKNNISGKNRYFAQICHISSHIKWTKQVVGDNLSPMQRFFIELFEDSRVEYLAMQKYPGLRYLWQKLHPVPIDNDCDDKNISCVRHRMAQLSYKILNSDYKCSNQIINEYVDKFLKMMQTGEHSTAKCLKIGLDFTIKAQLKSDSYSQVYFKNTLIDYRDDNRTMWLFHEENDEPEDMMERKTTDEDKKTYGIPYLYDEWDYIAKIFKPDWVTLYESKYAEANSDKINNILLKHKKTTNKLKKLLDSLKPQNHKRLRYQEDGTELDTDIAIGSYIDYKSGIEIDNRINANTTPYERDIALSLLLDLSASGNNKINKKSSQTILNLLQEAIVILSWAIEQLQDNFAIAGFNSNGRHFVGYYHIKGYSEKFDDSVKKRLSAMRAGLSTRMGAAMRHSGNILQNQKNDKKIVLILTDGEPADIDVKDQNLLIEDAKQARIELQQKNIFTYCINLDKKSDQYVKRISLKNYAIIDDILTLPEKLAQIFLKLTK